MRLVRCGVMWCWCVLLRVFQAKVADWLSSPLFASGLDNEDTLKANTADTSGVTSKRRPLVHQCKRVLMWAYASWLLTRWRWGSTVHAFVCA